jgi:Na+/H+-translocating membrane pyrophosphatase
MADRHAMVMAPFDAAMPLMTVPAVMAIVIPSIMTVVIPTVMAATIPTLVMAIAAMFAIILCAGAGGSGDSGNSESRSGDNLGKFHDFILSSLERLEQKENTLAIGSRS